MRHMILRVGTTGRPIDASVLAAVAGVASATVSPVVDGDVTVDLSSDVDDMTAGLVRSWADLQASPTAQRRFEVLAEYARRLVQFADDAAEQVTEGVLLLVAMAARSVAEETARATAAEKALAGRLATLEQQLVTVNARLGVKV